MEKLDGQEDGAVEVEEVGPSYKFAPEILEEMGRSIPLLLSARLCDAALAKLKEPSAWQTMTYKELRKLFKDNCANQDGYFSPQAPLLETVVRMLLAAKRDSLTLGEIHTDVSGGSRHRGRGTSRSTPCGECWTRVRRMGWFGQTKASVGRSSLVHGSLIR
jgi:hypothetical protein